MNYLVSNKIPRGEVCKNSNLFRTTLPKLLLCGRGSAFSYGPVNLYRSSIYLLEDVLTSSRISRTGTRIHLLFFVRRQVRGTHRSLGFIYTGYGRYVSEGNARGSWSSNHGHLNKIRRWCLRRYINYTYVRPKNEMYAFRFHYPGCEVLRRGQRKWK